MSDSLLNKSFSDIFKCTHCQTKWIIWTVARLLKAASEVYRSTMEQPQGHFVPAALTPLCNRVATIERQPLPRTLFTVMVKWNHYKSKWLGLTEVSCTVSSGALRSLEKLHRANDLLGKGIVDIKGSVGTNARNINKKLQQTAKNAFGPRTHFPNDHSIRNINSLINSFCSDSNLTCVNLSLQFLHMTSMTHETYKCCQGMRKICSDDQKTK